MFKRSMQNQFEHMTDSSMANEVSCSRNSIGIFIEKGFLLKEIRLTVYPLKKHTGIEDVKIEN